MPAPSFGSQPVRNSSGWSAQEVTYPVAYGRQPVRRVNRYGAQRVKVGARYGGVKHRDTAA